MRDRDEWRRRSTWCSLRTLGPVRRCAILIRSGLRCTWCLVDLDQRNAQIDHVVRRAEGGTDTNDNLVGSCDTCNSRRPAEVPAPAVLSLPLDLAAGRVLALSWYSWFAARVEDNRLRRCAARVKAAEKARAA